MRKSGLVDKLMVVAHPDDETLFGGQELVSSKNWLVVCLTNGNQLSRSNQFYEVLSLVGAKGIIWEYPDRPGLSKKKEEAKQGWRPFFTEIKKKLIALNKTYSFKKIVTHNTTGEYGHQHHIMVHELVTAVFAKELIYCFGHGDRINQSILAQKLKLLEIYDDQFSRKEKEKYAVWINQARIYPYVKNL